MSNTSNASNASNTSNAANAISFSDSALVRQIANSNNPATKLHWLLFELNNFSRKNRGYPMSTISQNAFSEVLGIRNTPLLLFSITKLATLPLAIEYQISKISDINHALYLRWLPQLRAGFSGLNLASDISNFLACTNGDTYYGLEMCADILSRKMPDKIISYDELFKIWKQSVNVHDTTVKSDIENPVKDCLLDNLQSIITATEEYKFVGTKPLKEVFEKTIGSAAINPGLYSKAKTTKASKDFWEIMSHIKLLLDVIIGPLQITEKVINLLSN